MEKIDSIEKIAGFSLTREEVLHDYRVAYRSRQASLIGRREVLSGKAKFGIFGDGKELPQIAMAKVFQKGDFRSGYYRDQTFMFAISEHTIQEFFAQLYAHPDVEAEPATAGRSMNAHFATRSLDEIGAWLPISERFNSAADLSPVASQMPRLVGLAYASRLYRELEALHALKDFSHHGDEVAFGTIGNAGCAEGMFWESINAIGLLRSPVVLSIWDDGYGISVTNEYQILNENISDLLEGFRRREGQNAGFDIYTEKAWDYVGLLRAYRRAAMRAREHHIPAILHVTEMTQPQGHSTSGSHERYKPKERLAWEEQYDCIDRMRQWIITVGLATAEELTAYEIEDRKSVEGTRQKAWEAFLAPLKRERDELIQILHAAGSDTGRSEAMVNLAAGLKRQQIPHRRTALATAHEALITLRDAGPRSTANLQAWIRRQTSLGRDLYSSHLWSQSSEAALLVPEIKPVYQKNSPRLNGFEILNACFDSILGRDPRVVAFGEDVGKLGGVNQAFAGLQAKYGELRVTDTGIREATILGQAIGMALRGLRPIAEIQYLDYVLYVLQIMSDDLANLHWRTRGGQKAPVIIRTRGHRLEGIWHAGSPMAAIIHLSRGIHILVPRDMTRAAGFYNTLLRADEPGMIVEVLNGYRLKERLPENIGEFNVPVGVPEILRAGTDVTVVTYGAMCRIAMEAAADLERFGIDIEVIDVQSLLPFDIHGAILESLKKTNRIVFTDEDVPGGTTAYMMQQVLEVQGGFSWLDSPPCTLPGSEHRPSYGSDGDYFSKPNQASLFEAVYNLMREADPGRFPDLL